VSRLNWGLISGLTMGIGIWAMHFIDMLALSLPCRVAYDPFVTLISTLPGVMAGGVAMGAGWIGTRRLPPFMCSVLVGTGIGTMHYTGMAAMRLDGFVRYDPTLFGLSICAAIALAYAALRIKTSNLHLAGFPRDALIATTLGCAVAGMHYIAMSSAYFVRGDVSALPQTIFTPNTLAIAIAIITAFVALGALTLAAISRNREITDQLRAGEANIRLLLTEKETILSNALVGIAFIRHRQIVSCNQRFDEIFQCATAELVGVSTGNLYASVQANGQSGEFQMRHKDGSVFWGRLSGKAIDPGQPDEGSIWICSDISERKLAEDELRVASIAFESQEGMMIANVEDTIQKMTELKTQGVGFSLDDFGTGYSSLAYLKKLPLDQLKIDQGFVRDILFDANDAAIAKMVIVLAESLGLPVIAEGVETEAQRDFLARLGCAAYQGYLFSRPLPLGDFEVLTDAGACKATG
jgi:PAS domain S-box-containing protein